jgi:toxin ParE2
VKLRLTAFAKREPFRVHDYYEKKAPGLGNAFFDDVTSTFALIKQHPNVWRKMGRYLRRCRLSKFKYGILYRVYDDSIVVFVVGHLSRSRAFWSKASRRG